MSLPVQSAMIIDDDNDLGQLLAEILKTRKIHALTVQTLWEAEEYLTFLKPSVIFLDNSFPEGLGINFIRDIRSADREIKIIMMTADTSLWIKQKSLEEGVDYFLEKPVSKIIIDEVLDKLKIRKKPNKGFRKIFSRGLSQTKNIQQLLSLQKKTGQGI